MTYRLRITRMEPNENFVAESAEFEKRRSYGYNAGPYNDGAPPREFEITSLETIITPEEWETIKQALITHWVGERQKEPMP